MTLTYKADERTLEKVIRSILEHHAALKGHVANEFMCELVFDSVTFTIYGIMQDARLALAHLGATYEMHYDGRTFECSNGVVVELDEVSGVIHGKSFEDFVSSVGERLREEVREVKERYGA